MEYIRERNNESSWRDELGTDFKKNKCFSLSFKSRLYGFAACFVTGMVLSRLSTVFLSIAKLTAFSICYSFGSLIALLSTAFLVGPCRQLKLMFKRYRWAATVVYLLLIALTLFVGLYKDSNGDPIRRRVLLIIVLVLLQCLAGIWYSLSYIPYARKVVWKFVSPCIDKLFDE